MPALRASNAATEAPRFTANSLAFASCTGSLRKAATASGSDVLTPAFTMALIRALEYSTAKLPIAVPVAAPAIPPTTVPYTGTTLPARAPAFMPTTIPAREGIEDTKLWITVSAIASGF